MLFDENEDPYVPNSLKIEFRLNCEDISPRYSPSPAILPSKVVAYFFREYREFI
jgi:hypothetical protein